MTTSADKSFSLLIKEKAHNLGFDLCGIAPSKILKEHEPIIREWCAYGMKGDMNYLCQNLQRRINPDLLFPGVKSIIVTGLNYYTERKLEGEGIPVISRYAYGVNYHDVIRYKLGELLNYIYSISPGTVGNIFVDSAPVLEKAWAREAGLGWPGKHSILINNEIGSFFFIGIILLNICLDYNEPFKEDRCGTCRLCIESCPTGAINENRTIDARRCIAYLTVESKSPLPEELAPKIGRRVFGCDRCQEVCPWNKAAKPHNNTEFELPEELEQMSREKWISLTREQFSRLFKRSPIGRRRYELFMKNVAIITKTGS